MMRRLVGLGIVFSCCVAAISFLSAAQPEAVGFTVSDLQLISTASRTDWTGRWTAPVEAATIMAWFHQHGFPDLLTDLNGDGVIDELDTIELADRFGKTSMETTTTRGTTDPLLVYGLAQYVAKRYPKEFELKIYDAGFPAEFARDTHLPFSSDVIPGITLTLKPEPSYAAYQSELRDGQGVIVGIEQQADRNYYLAGRSFLFDKVKDGNYAVDLAWAEDDPWQPGAQGQVLQTEAKETDALYLSYQGAWMKVECMLALSPMQMTPPAQTPSLTTQTPSQMTQPPQPPSTACAAAQAVPSQGAGEHSSLCTSDGSIRDDQLANYVCSQIPRDINGVPQVKDVKIMANSCYGGGMLDDFARVFAPGGACAGVPWVGGAASAAWELSWGISDKIVGDPANRAKNLGCFWTNALAGRVRDMTGNAPGSIRDRASDNVVKDLEAARDNDELGPNHGGREHPVVAWGNCGSGITWTGAAKHAAVIFGGINNGLRHDNNIENVDSALTALWGESCVFKGLGDSTRDTSTAALKGMIADACKELDKDTELVLYFDDHGDTEFDILEYLSAEAQAAAQAPTRFGELLETLQATEIGCVTSVAFTHDPLLASGSGDNTVKLWDLATALATGKEMRTLTGHTSYVDSVAFSPDDTLLASGSHDKTIAIWDVATGDVVRILEGHTAPVWTVAFSPDGTLLASGSWDNTVKLWDVATGAEVHTLEGHTAPVSRVAFSPDGTLLASGSWDNTVKLWDVATGAEVRTLRDHANAVLSVAFSPDGKFLASGSYDMTVRLWDVDTGTRVFTVAGHTDRVCSVAFSPDGKLLASGSYDNTVKLWDSATGAEVLTLEGHTDAVWDLAFSSDGRVLASASGDHTVKLWSVSAQAASSEITGVLTVILPLHQG